MYLRDLQGAISYICYSYKISFINLIDFVTLANVRKDSLKLM